MNIYLLTMIAENRILSLTCFLDEQKARRALAADKPANMSGARWQLSSVTVGFKREYPAGLLGWMKPQIGLAIIGAQENVPAPESVGGP